MQYDDLTQGVLTLRAQNEFVMDWVKSNFLHDLVAQLELMLRLVDSGELDSGFAVDETGCAYPGVAAGQAATIGFLAALVRRAVAFGGGYFRPHDADP